MQTTIEQLSETIGVAVSPEHRFGTDAFLLADFAAPRHKDKVCDLGTGCGIIPLYLMKRYQPAHCTGVEIQRQAVEQFREGIAYSGLEGVLTAVHADLCALEGKLEAGSFDLVTCNPPYKANGAGIESGNDSERIARHEIMCDIRSVCAAAGRLLRFGGRVCLCQRPERLADVLCAMREYRLEPKCLQMVAKNEKSAPWLFLVEGKKGSKPFLQVLPPLLIEQGGSYFGLANQPV